MRITAIQAIPITVPRFHFRSALGLHTSLDYGVVIVQTDTGLEGLGEISHLWDGRGHLQCAIVDQVFAPALVGQDPLAINHCLRLMDTLTLGAWPARAAVEMALFDLAGKALNAPVYQLLGGRARESITLSRSVTMATPAEMAADAARFVAEGYTCVKVKVGREPAEDIAAVAAVRAAIGPTTLLRVDANMGWRTPKEAIRVIKRLEAFDLHSVEQPLPPGELNDLRLIRSAVDVPLMVDESVWGPRDAWQILKAEAADMLNVYVAESGGLTNSALIFRLAETVGVPCLIGAMPELGIGTAAQVHLGVAMTNLSDPCDACGVIYQSTDIVRERFRVEGGKIWPLDGPGLGVTLDRDRLEEYRVR